MWHAQPHKGNMDDCDMAILSAMEFHFVVLEHFVVKRGCKEVKQTPWLLSASELYWVTNPHRLGEF
jgi:hypothetical protein